MTAHSLLSSLLPLLTPIVMLLALALLFGGLLGFAATRFRVEGNPLVDRVNALLPQTQCGQCNYAGCRPYAEAIAEGRAPQALASLPDPDRVVIGGGGKDRAAILQAVLQRLRPAGVVVIPLATIEALAELRPLLEQAGLAVRVGQLQAWRGAALADGTRLAPLNPVVLLRGESAPLGLA
mgnify:CR=1 FL=1